MKPISLVVLLVVGLSAIAVAKPVVTKELVEHINSVQKSWVASTQSPMATLTEDEAVRRLGVKPEKRDILYPRRHYSASDRLSVPASFDSRDNWPQCSTMRAIRDQSDCGSCYAISAVAAMSDRICVFTKEIVSLSTEFMNSCSGAGNCEDGGPPMYSWMTWQEDGVPSEDCMPYSLPGCDHHIPGSLNPCPSNYTYPTPACNLTCRDGYPKTLMQDLHFGKDVHHLEGEADMMAELAQNGPFTVTFTVYDEFYSYHSGIYHHVSGKRLGGHAVKLVGYGEESGEKYWLIANSWNEKWGEKGFFRIRRGTNECGIEGDGVAAVPRS